MTTYLLRSKVEKTPDGIVMYMVYRDGELMSTVGMDFSQATDFVHHQAKDGDTIQEVDGDKPPYHQRVYPLLK